ncbi:MAG: PSD1 and planctomycete cytochrome C domain-containing protein [Planctomycetaceae bacterium]
MSFPNVQILSPARFSPQRLAEDRHPPSVASKRPPRGAQGGPSRPRLATGAWCGSLGLAGWLAALLGCGGVVAAQERQLPPALPRTVDFDREIRPLLATHCLACHGAVKQVAGLRLDREADALRGGDSGKAFEPGRAAESLFMKYVGGLDPDILMPPEGDPLPVADVALLRTWIDQGAKWGAGPVTASGSSAARHWAFQPVLRPVPPEVRQAAWPKNLVDRFILAKLEAAQLGPAPPAPLPTLARRVALDLTGLPPDPDRVAALVADPRPNAYELYVEELLASPHFGERWARHWLDQARYADSDGYEKDGPRPWAWRYRDWVINALNSDLPFNQFSIEQLAGDLLPNATLAQRTATGFHRQTLTNKEGGVDAEEFRVAAVVDRVNTTATVWLGLTMGCAQCHTHKYDPLTLHEYYSLFAFFNTADEVDLPAPLPSDDKAVVPALAQPADPRMTHVLLKGDFLRPGDTVTPATPAVLPPLPPPASGPPTRLDLARWLVHPRNPLAARVFVNRVWGRLFATPLVRSDEDFGTRGELPSHPELLDWLAAEFTLPTLEMLPPPQPPQPPAFRGGFSLKRLLKILVCSATYRQQSAPRAEERERDPLNRLLSRQNRPRLEAEIIRDSALKASGLLTPTLGGPSVRPPQPAGISELTYAGSAKWVESQGPDRYRRGLYTWFQRTSPHPLLQTFDAPESNVTCTRRERSNTPLQSLTLLNDTMFLECAKALGHRVMRAAPRSIAERGRWLYQLALLRDPTPAEGQALLDLAAELRAELAADPARAAQLATLGQVPPPAPIPGGPGAVGSAPAADQPTTGGGPAQQPPAANPAATPADGAACSVESLSPEERLDLATAVALARVVLNLDEFITRE